MKIDKNQLENLDKTAQKIEQHLESVTILTDDHVENINKELDVILAELGSYKRFFKRLS